MTDKAPSSFGEEVLDYWIPRLVADGVDANDAKIVRSRVTGWNDWAAAWSEIAGHYRELARQRLGENARLTAGEALVRASLCYHVGQIPATGMPELKRDLQERKVAAFRSAAPLLDPPAERLEIEHDGIALPGYLRLPAQGSGACVVLVPGLDSTKEDFFSLSEMCLRRGLATFAFDGPGQGEARQQTVLAEGYEACITTVLDFLIPRVDSARIGLLGRSLGGHYILRAAAIDKRIAACAVFGGAYDLSDWNEMPETILDGFMFATGADSRDHARALIGSATLDDCIHKVACPILIVHGKRDAIFHWTQATRIANALGDKAVLKMDENGVHCCHNHAFEYRTAIADWLARALTTP